MRYTQDLSKIHADALDLIKLDNMLSEIKGQPDWRTEADKAADYYDGRQLDRAVIDELKRRGQPVLIHNLIAPAIDGVLGLEAKTRTNWSVVADDDSGVEVAEALDVELNEAARLSRADRACSDAFAAQVKTGLGWVEVNRNADPFKYKYRVNYVSRREIFWDWSSTEPDLSDARWLVRRKWLEKDELVSAFPKHKDQIDEILRGEFDANNWGENEVLGGETNLVGAYTTISKFMQDKASWLQGEQQRVMTYEIYYRTYHRKLVLTSYSGDVVEYDENNELHLAAVASGQFDVSMRIFTKMRVAYFAGYYRFVDVESPHPHNKFPYVPFWGYREDGSAAPYGLIRRMMPAQDEINFRRSKLTQALNRVIVQKDADALSNMSDDDLMDELRRTDSVVNLNPNRKNAGRNIDINFSDGIASQQFQVMTEAQRLIQDTAGIYSAFLGQDSGAKSGVAINSLVEQGSTTLGEINDNYRFGRNLVGELLLANIINDMGDRTHEVITNVGKADKSKTIVLNQREVDENGEHVITNNVQKVKTQVALADIATSPAYRQQIASNLINIMSGMPPEFQLTMMDMVIELTDGIPSDKRNEMLKRIRKLNGNDVSDPEAMSEQELAAAEAQAQEAQMQQQLQQREIELQMAKLESEVRANNARAAEIEAKAQALQQAPEKTGAEIDKMRAETDRILSELAMNSGNDHVNRMVDFMANQALGDFA